MMVNTIIVMLDGSLHGKCDAEHVKYALLYCLSVCCFHCLRDCALNVYDDKMMVKAITTLLDGSQHVNYEVKCQVSECSQGWKAYGTKVAKVILLKIATLVPTHVQGEKVVDQLSTIAKGSKTIRDK